MRSIILTTFFAVLVLQSLGAGKGGGNGGRGGGGGRTRPPGGHTKKTKSSKGATKAANATTAKPDWPQLSDRSELRFPPSKLDMSILNQLNTIRSIVAKGVLAKIFYDIEHRDLSTRKMGFKHEPMAEVKEGWGRLYVDSEQALRQFQMEDQLEFYFHEFMEPYDESIRRARGIIEWFEGVVDWFKEATISAVKAIRKFFVETVFKIPKNVLGPAAAMNLLVWNRRLAQLAVLKVDEFDKGLREVVYENNTYRMFEYGNLMDVILEKVLEDIATQVETVFLIKQVSRLALKLIFSRYDAPVKDVKEIENSIYEVLFADRNQVGCLAGRICVIGPVTNRTGYFYESGPTCSKCKSSCVYGLCRPRKDYSLYHKYQKYMVTPINKFPNQVEEEGVGAGAQLYPGSGKGLNNWMILVVFCFYLLI